MDLSSTAHLGEEPAELVTHFTKQLIQGIQPPTRERSTMEHYTRSISAKQYMTYFFFSSSILPSLPSRSLSMSSTWSKQEMTHPLHIVRVPLQLLSTFRHYCLAHLFFDCRDPLLSPLILVNHLHVHGHVHTCSDPCIHE